MVLIRTFLMMCDAPFHTPVDHVYVIGKTSVGYFAHILIGLFLGFFEGFFCFVLFGVFFAIELSEFIIVFLY